jgi:glutamate synthase (NADPH/NADH) small chain
MTDAMQKYVGLARRPPDERSIAERLSDFREVHLRLDAARAAEQASRCEQCGVPFCQVHCPLHNNIPDWLKLTAEGRLEEAYRLAQSTNNLPEICGRLCPQDRLCEAKWACTLEQAGHGTVTIGAVEQFLGDTAWAEGWVTPRRPRHETGRSIGIVGAGPAGLAAAEELRALGHAVMLYDRQPQPGGLLRYGIPGFKMDKQVIARRTGLLLQAGIDFTGGFALGRDATLETLRERHDAVLLALGAYRPNRLQLSGAMPGQIVDGLAYLIASMDQEAGLCLPDGTALDAARRRALDAGGRDVAVIGGGDTAIDCVRTALRQDARSVTCLYRRGEFDRPGSRRELDKARAEGVTFLWHAEGTQLAPAAAPNQVAMVQAVPEACDVAVPRQLAVRVGTGRGQPAAILTLPADMIVAAIGSSPASGTACGAAGPATRADGRVIADPQSGATSLAGVFAAGDLARGPSLAVWAIRDGRAAAAAIDRWLARIPQAAGLAVAAG